MTDDYVLYNVDEFYNPITFSNVDEIVEYGKRIGFNSKECDDFATKVFNYEVGQKFEFKGLSFIVWDDEFEGYHEYHASTKKTMKSTSKPQSFSDMVKKQRGKNKSIAKDYDDDGYPPMMNREKAEGICFGLVGIYHDEDQITALFSLIANGSQRKYEELWTRFSSDYIN